MSVDIVRRLHSRLGKRRAIVIGTASLRRQAMVKLKALGPDRFAIVLPIDALWVGAHAVFARKRYL